MKKKELARIKLVPKWDIWSKKIVQKVVPQDKQSVAQV